MSRQNPIEDYEYLHQKRIERKHSTRLRRWIPYLMVIPVVSSLLLSIPIQIDCMDGSMWNWGKFLAIDDMSLWAINFIGVFLVVLVTFFTIPTRSFLLCYNSIHRQQSNTLHWSLLKLSLVSSRQFVYGKMRVIWRMTRRDYAYLVLLYGVFYLYYFAQSIVTIGANSQEQFVSCSWYNVWLGDLLPQILFALATLIPFVIFDAILSITAGVFFGMLALPDSIASMVNVFAFVLMRAYSMFVLYVIYLVMLGVFEWMNGRYFYGNLLRDSLIILGSFALIGALLQLAVFLGVRRHNFNKS